MLPPSPVARYRVLYGDTDQMGFLYYANHFRLFEIGRAEWIRARGLSYRDLEAAGTLLPVVEAQARYRAPARYDDIVVIAAAPAEYGWATVKFQYVLTHEGDGRVLCEGYTLHAFMSRNGRPQRIPQEVLALFEQQV
jgi:acyl-CoA thioester hydrolase